MGNFRKASVWLWPTFLISHFASSHSSSSANGPRTSHPVKIWSSRICSNIVLQRPYVAPARRADGKGSSKVPSGPPSSPVTGGGVPVGSARGSGSRASASGISMSSCCWTESDRSGASTSMKSSGGGATAAELEGERDRRRDLRKRRFFFMNSSRFFLQAGAWCRITAVSSAKGNLQYSHWVMVSEV